MMALLLAQYKVHLEGLLLRWHRAAKDCRQSSEECINAALIAGDPDMRSVQYERSSSFLRYAEQLDSDAEALDAVLSASELDGLRAVADRERIAYLLLMSEKAER